MPILRFNSLLFSLIIQDGNKTNTIHNLLFCSNSQLIFQPLRYRCNKESSSKGLWREHTPLLPYPGLCFGNSTGRDRTLAGRGECHQIKHGKRKNFASDRQGRVSLTCWFRLANGRRRWNAADSLRSSFLFSLSSQTAVMFNLETGLLWQISN